MAAFLWFLLPIGVFLVSMLLIAVIWGSWMLYRVMRGCFGDLTDLSEPRP